MRTSFLHVADTRLGYRDPADPEGSFEAGVNQFRFAVDFALEQRAAFIVFSGNLFDSPDLEPATLHVVLRGLSRLAEKNLTAIAIRGRRDLASGASAMTWYDLLSQEGLLATLEVGPAAEGQMRLARWERQASQGSYVDLTRCRVFGLHYYGAMSGSLLTALSRAVNAMDNREMDFRVLLVHGPLEHFSQVSGAKLSYSDLLLLRRQVDYIALGGCEQTYDAEGWAYNPGAAGFYHVLVDTAVQPKHQARFVAYPAAMLSPRPAPQLERPRRGDLEEAIFDELAPAEQRDVVRLVTQSMWQAPNAILHRQLLDLAAAKQEAHGAA